MDFIYKHKKLAKFILSRISPSYIESKGQKGALNVYNNALIKRPAYSAFLNDQDFKASSINTIERFSQVPIMDKDNYINAYEESKVTKEVNPYLIYRSSGYTGGSTYWTQDTSDYDSLIKYMDFNLRFVFDIDEKKTLFISMFALSSWITGQQVLVGLTEVANRYRNVSVFACGMEAEEAYDVLKKYGKDFEQVVILSYPLTFKEFIDISINDGHDLTQYNIYAVIGAEGVTYSWSKYYNSVLNKEGENKFRIISSYGTADTGIGISSEQVSCQLIKEICHSNPEVLKALSGSEEMPLHFFQYNPIENYFEVVDGELIVTKDKHLPLVRYNLHDRAKLLSFNEVVETLRKFGYDLKQMTEENGSKLLTIPFMLMYGRTDGTIILNGANIYINSFMEALQNEEIRNLHTGKFRVLKFDEADNFQNFTLQIELHKHIEKTDKLKETIRRVLIDFLVENDPGYKKAYHERYASDRVCKVVFTEFEDEDTIKHRFK